MTAPPAPRRRVTPPQIADLLARVRSLSGAGPAADPAEVAAYLAVKADLLAAITDPGHHPEPPCGHHHQEQR
ncbi:MAG: hypothetical protein ACR2GH_11170 [Pseudonocardia sp.]